MADLTSLADRMDEIACETWDRVVREDGRGGRFGEVTITELNVSKLRDFATAHPSIPLRFDQLDPNKENERGLDFEIWIELADHGWLGYSMQAKRINPTPPPESYLELSHKGGLTDPAKPEGRTNPRDRFQYETLIRHAESVGSNPVHLFYNGWANGGQPQLGSTPLSVPPLQAGLFGCAALSTYQLVELRGQKSRHPREANLFTPSMVPWSALFRLAPPAAGTPLGYPPSPGKSGLSGVQPSGGPPQVTPGDGIDTAQMDQVEAAARVVMHGNQTVAIADALPSYLTGDSTRVTLGNLVPGQIRPRHALVIRQDES
ncbi:hypothetical protein [Frigoribacterium sp. Leaf186]|uniref:hypothetical protein n=1 Tax=Frigoribacterium sp. Leaf186 TaxID=1736293 RepID=UPI0012FA413E|nr:hypothetical protein [Frigoribacterium sp. Leaf186]